MSGESRRRSIRCVVLHQAVPADAPLDELDVLAEAASVERALRICGFKTSVIPVTLDLGATVLALRQAVPDLVFNLVESLAGGGAMAAAAPALLNHLGLRHTGSGFAAIALTSSKPATNAALRAAGLPVPPGPSDGWGGRFIVKHATEHASFGLGAHSVVSSLPVSVPKGWFAEAFIDGRELTVSLIGGPDGDVAAFPVAELIFEDWPSGMPTILDYAGKWQTDHPLYARTSRRFGVDAALAAELVRIARRCWQVLGLSGYARIDFRLGADGVAYVIDVNANPCLAEDAGFAAAAAEAGIGYATLVERIAVCAISDETRSEIGAARHRDRPRVPRQSVSLRSALRPSDDIGALCRATGFFNAAEILVAEELAYDRRHRGEASDYRFLLADGPRGLLGYACYGRTSGAEVSWDLYWIVVHPAVQGGGIGRILVEAVLEDIASSGGLRLYAETASKALYAPTRAFYAASGFVLQAAVPDFYAPQDAKQIWLRMVG